MKEIYLIRHGETEWSREGKHTGLTDISLTEKGEKEALTLGKRLKGIHFDHIFSSPLKRVKETCTICGFNPQIDKALLEWNYGAYEGVTSEEIYKTYPDWNIFTHGAPGGESTDDIVKRVDHFLKKIESLDGNIALFSSGHISRALTIRWLELPIQEGKRFSLSTGSLSILGYEHKNRALKLWNDIPYHD